MAKKMLTVHAESVERAIEKGLAEIGLPKERTYIEIKQKESKSLFSRRPAIVSIAFDPQEVEEVKKNKYLQTVSESIEVFCEDETIFAKIPSSFLESASMGVEEKRKALLHTLEKHLVYSPDPQLLDAIFSSEKESLSSFPVKKLATTPLGDSGCRIFLEPSEDMMQCAAAIAWSRDTTSTPPVSFEQIIQALKEKSILKGVYKSRIEKELQEKSGNLFLIAQGKPADKSASPQVELFFQENERKAFQEMMQLLRIDTRDIKDLNICERNQLLARIHKGNPSEAGYRVDGQPAVDSTNTPSTIQVGKNTYLSEDESEVFSKEPGHIKWDPKTRSVSVEPVYIVEGNIDFSEGNLENFVGKVIIRGDVMPKFKVSVDGDIEIHGTVEDAIVESTKGSVSILGSVVHYNEGYVKAKKDLHVSIAQNAKLYGENIHIGKEAMNCYIEAEKSLYVEGSPGAIVGGQAFARFLVKANTIGSASWVKTAIHAGDIREDKKRQRRLKNEVHQSSSLIDSLSESKAILNKLAEKGLSESQEQELAQINQELNQHTERVRVYTKEISILTERIESMKKARIEVYDRIYPQVDLYIYDKSFIPSEEHRFCTFICKHKQVEIIPL